MKQDTLVALINNAAFMLVLSVVYEAAYYLPAKYRRVQPYISGILIAVICSAVMITPFTLQSGIIFDTRSILISVTALIFGFVPTAITVVAAAIVRLLIGGAGTIPGLSVILTSALIGLAWRCKLYPKTAQWRWLNIYAMSITVHVVMLACMLLFPYPDNLYVIHEIAIPVMLIYPVATVLLSLLLMRQHALRQMQDQLKQSEVRFKNIAESISDVVWQADMNLTTTYISPSVEKLLGESPEEHMKRKLEDKFPEQTLHKIRGLLHEEIEKEKDPAMNRNRSRTIEIEHYRADGTLIWIEISVSILRDALGNMTGFLGVSRDIMQRKQAEIALKESERSKSVLLANLPGMAYRCKYDREWTMQFVSAGSIELTGYSPESLIDNRELSFNDLISPEYRDTLWVEWNHILPQGLPFKCEYEIATRDGQRKWSWN